MKILFQIYQYLAEWLTEKELLRTQTEFDDSLTLKIYLLQFVNYYASIFYIAFFKGKFVGRPGDYVRFFGHRQEEVTHFIIIIINILYKYELYLSLLLRSIFKAIVIQWVHVQL